MQARTDPLVIGAVGGSGTRVFSRIARDAGVFMGTRVDDQEDSRAMSGFYGEFASDYLAANGNLDHEHERTLDERLNECLDDHLEALPRPDHPWGIKNPRSMLMLPFWHQSFSDMRFLHVIRDGRDMAYSDNTNQIRRHARAVLGPDLDRPAPERAMLWWARANTLAADYGEAKLGDRYMRVRLEDLVERPKRTIRSLHEFMDVRGRIKPAIAEVERPASLGRWRRQPEAEVASLVALGRDALERFGYDTREVRFDGEPDDREMGATPLRRRA